MLGSVIVGSRAEGQVESVYCVSCAKKVYGVNVVDVLLESEEQCGLLLLNSGIGIELAVIQVEAIERLLTELQTGGWSGNWNDLCVCGELADLPGCPVVVQHF